MDRNLNKGKCLVCGRIVYGGEGYRRYVRGRGLRVFCEEHANGLEHYHGSISLRAESVGTEKKTGLASTTVGVEIETDGASRCDSKYLRFRGTLERVGFVFESDCSIRTGEAPSPKMNGLATISSILRNNQDIIEELLNTDNTGAHTHVYCNDITYIRRYYHSIFVSFCEWLSAHESMWLVDNFGSDFRYYACKISSTSDALNHSNFVNVQHDNTLEFRLPRITGYKQYMKVIKFWREVGFMLNNFDFHKTADAPTRKRYARQAGDEIVKLATKYFGA